jgi:predicted nuclease with RNAse H fold
LKVYGGIDPSGSNNRPSGCVVLDQNATLLDYRLCKTDEDILTFFTPYPLKAIAIDAPKGLPLGMNLCCLDDDPTCACELTPARVCETEMRKRRIHLYPVTKNSFAKSWIRRGLLLFLRFQGIHIPTYEVYPSGTKKILFHDLDIPKPKSSKKSRKILQTALSQRIDDIPSYEKFLLSDHVLDAILGAFTVYLYREKKKGELIGRPVEGQILLPTL